MPSGLTTFDPGSTLWLCVFSHVYIFVISLKSFCRAVCACSNCVSRNVSVCLHVQQIWRCWCNHYIHPPPHHPPSPCSLNAHSSLGLMVECLSNFCLVQGLGFEKGNGIRPEKMLQSICQHWRSSCQSVNISVHLHSFSQISMFEYVFRYVCKWSHWGA